MNKFYLHYTVEKNKLIQSNWLHTATPSATQPPAPLKSAQSRPSSPDNSTLNYLDRYLHKDPQIFIQKVRATKTRLWPPITSRHGPTKAVRESSIRAQLQPKWIERRPGNAPVKWIVLINTYFLFGIVKAGFFIFIVGRGVYCIRAEKANSCPRCLSSARCCKRGVGA